MAGDWEDEAAPQPPPPPPHDPLRLLPLWLNGAAEGARLAWSRGVWCAPPLIWGKDGGAGSIAAVDAATTAETDAAVCARPPCPPRRDCDCDERGGGTGPP
jgi:hypothetical protein